MNKYSDTVLSAFLCAALVSARQMFIRHCVAKIHMEFFLYHLKRSLKAQRGF